MDTYDMIFDIFIILSGIYAIYQVFSKKSVIKNTDNVKNACKKNYIKFMKRFCLSDGLIAIAMGTLDCLKIQPIALIMFFILCAAVVATMIFNAFSVVRN